MNDGSMIRKFVCYYSSVKKTDAIWLDENLFTRQKVSYSYSLHEGLVPKGQHAIEWELSFVHDIKQLNKNNNKAY